MIGAWLNYVAVFSLVESFSGSSLALSGVVLIRFLPSLLLAPVTGVMADRWVVRGAGRLNNRGTRGSMGGRVTSSGSDSGRWSLGTLKAGSRSKQQERVADAVRYIRGESAEASTILLQ